MVKGRVRNEKQRRAYYYNHERRQMSDHSAMGLESKIDYAERYLKKRAAES
jgi:hypothetical protein